VTNTALTSVEPAQNSRTSTNPDDSTASLRGAGVVLGFGDHTVVNGVDIALRAGQVTALVGPNGSGKSTLLRGLAKLHPAAGTIVLTQAMDAEPRPIHSMRPREFAQEVTLFAQSRIAPQGLSVKEVVAFGRYPYRRRFSGLTREDHAAIESALRATGLNAIADRAAGTLSGGELQRVWLAACLAQQTGVVLLDEPTNHLDLRYQIETLDVIRDLADDHEVAVGVVLHDLDHAAQVADELLLMRAGQIVAKGTPVDVLTAENIAHAYEIRVDVRLDQHTGRLRIDPIGRHAPRPHTHTSSDS
jgi:iron complex transport system ATP-binding protein